MLPYKKSLDQNYAQNATWITPIMIWVIVYCYFPIYDKKVTNAPISQKEA